MSADEVKQQISTPYAKARDLYINRRIVKIADLESIAIVETPMPAMEAADLMDREISAEDKRHGLVSLRPPLPPYMLASRFPDVTDRFITEAPGAGTPWMKLALWVSGVVGFAATVWGFFR